MENENKFNKEFETSSLAMSAFMMAHGLKLQRTRKEGSKVVFIFLATESQRKLSTDFFNNEPVPGLDFWDYIRRIKSIIHES